LLNIGFVFAFPPISCSLNSSFCALHLTHAYFPQHLPRPTTLPFYQIMSRKRSIAESAEVLLVAPPSRSLDTLTGPITLAAEEVKDYVLPIYQRTIKATPVISFKEEISKLIVKKKRKLEGMQEAMDKLKDDLNNSWNTKFEGLQKMYQQVQEKNEVLNQQVQELRNYSRQLLNANGRLQERVETLETQNEELTLKIERMEENLGEVHLKLGEANQRIEKLEKERDEVRQRVRNLNECIESFRTPPPSPRNNN
jgi:methyl-accepting chemotaxis protein